MSDAERRLTEYRKHTEMLAKFIAYYEMGEVIRPLGQDPAEATAKHLEKLKVDKAYFDDLIPRLEIVRGEMATRYADADPEEGVMVTGVGPMNLRRAVRKRTDWRHHHGLSLISVFRGANKDPSTFDPADLDRLAELERFR